VVALEDSSSSINKIASSNLFGKYNDIVSKMVIPNSKNKEDTSKHE
jgi:hypothetical protein